MQLDNEQLRIVNAPFNEQQLVLAGPGTGKTEVVAHRIIRLLSVEQLKPRQILVLSFSRNAVKVLSDRIRSIQSVENVILEELRHITVRTFDSWSFRLLRNLNYPPEELIAGGFDSTIEKAVNEIKQNGSQHLDNPTTGLKPLKNVIIDELQDITGIRAQLIRCLLLLFTSQKRSDFGFTLLGDGNQAIYDWLAENNLDTITASDNIDKIKRDFSKGLVVRELMKNHRSEKSVADIIERAASLLLNSQAGSRPASMALREIIETLPVGDLSSKSVINNSDTAILCRDNGQALLQALRIINQESGDVSRYDLEIRAGDTPRILPPWIGLVFHLYQGTTLNSNIMPRLLNALKTKGVPIPTDIDSDTIWKRILNAAHLPENEISIEMSKFRERVKWWDSLPDDDGILQNKLVFTTIHQSKGSEFDQVLLLHDGILEETGSSEECRVAYVGISRAKKKIARINSDENFWLTCRQTRNGRQRWFGTHPVEGRRKWINYIETGIGGDVLDVNFIHPRIHEDKDSIERSQKYIVDNWKSIPGRKIQIVKKTMSTQPPRIRYDIYLETDQEYILLGSMHTQFREDLQYLIPRQVKSFMTLPKRITGLRVNSIYTCVGLPSDTEFIPEPWSKSLIWLGASFHGIGEFEWTYKR